MTHSPFSDDAQSLLASFREEFDGRTLSADTLMAFASFVQSHSNVRSVELQLLIVQALAQSAMLLGSNDAARFLTDQWPQLKAILARRWAREGFEP